jgi:hypothetical protein
MTSFKQASTSVTRINKINGKESNKMKSIHLSILFNMGYWNEVNH